MKRVLLGVVGIFVAQGVQGHPLDPNPYPPGYIPGQGPAIITRMPAGVPDSRVPAVGTFDAKSPFARPVAKLDGSPVYRPLFPSLVLNPVDRALIVRDYEKQHFHLPDRELDGACKRYQSTQFHDIAALRDLRLQKEKATLDDYRNYVAEEVKINAMLFNVYGYATSWAERGSLQKNYLTRLRRKSVIETVAS